MPAPLSSLLKMFVALLLGAALLLFILWRDAQRFLDAPLSAKSEQVTYQLPAGAGLQRVANSLHEAGLLSKPRYFSLYARYTGDAARLKAGEYQIDTRQSPRELLALLVAGKVVQHSFTIVEGWNIRELLAALSEDSVLQHSIEGDSSAARIESLMSALGRAGQHPEGRFLPDTYYFPRGTSDVEFLARAASAMDDTLAELWEKRADKLPLKTAEEALILASIVEKETAVASERPMIAGVFISRLRKGMRLQTDPTVIYGIGESFDGDIRRRDLRRDTPYNTYTRHGLTPTPIAMAGRAAIEAALHPADTEALFFVARGDGSHYFSKTLAEHESAVIKYQLGGDASRLRRGAQAKKAEN